MNKKLVAFLAICITLALTLALFACVDFDGNQTPDGRLIPNYTIPTGLTAFEGDILADVELPAGWEWVDSSQNVGRAGDTRQRRNARFKPDDIITYRPIVRLLQIDVLFDCGGTPFPTQVMTPRRSRNPYYQGYGEFFDLQDAFDSGFITRADLKNIAYFNSTNGIVQEWNPRANNRRGGLEAVEHIPVPIYPEHLCEEIIQKIRIDFYNTYVIHYISTYVSSGIRLEDIRIDIYAGTYNGFVAIRMFNVYSGPTVVMTGGHLVDNIMVRIPLFWGPRVMLWRLY